jgi:hypothetical protein
MNPCETGRLPLPIEEFGNFLEGEGGIFTNEIVFPGKLLGVRIYADHSGLSFLEKRGVEGIREERGV